MSLELKMPQTRNQTNAATQSKAGAMEAAEASTTKTDNAQGGTSSESDPPRRDSPDNCSICLGPFINKSFTSSCAHSFCFVCLKQWSKVKAECPLCKQPFTSIFHNIRSNQMYDIYELPRQPPNQVDQYNIYNYVGGGLTTFTAPTHHYLSLTQPFDADLTLSNFSRFQFRHRRYDRYLNPLSIHGEHQYSYTGPAVNPSAHASAASWPRGPEDFRREIYRHNLGPPVVILGNENSTYRLTPAMVAASSHRLQRIMPWLTRELRVLLRSHQNVRLAMSMIQPLLTQVSIDNVYFHERVAPLIGRRTRLFIQEFVAFANSALSMHAFDRKAMYRRRDESDAPSSPSSTSSENDVVEITDISPEPVVASTVSETLAASSQPLDLRRSGWDSPTPGPSWSNLGTRDTSAQAVPIDRVSVSSESEDPVYIPELKESDSDNSKVGSDIIFVKYDKPWEERSPINLTSDSEKESAEPERVKKKKKSKHKKKRKESNDLDTEKKDKDKSHKSSKGKSHSKDKSKSSRKGESGEERGSSVAGSTHKRHLSPCSPEVPRVKKHKKSKDRKERSSDQSKDRDRELVDRLFAEAFALQKGVASALEERMVDSNKSVKDKNRSSRSTAKDKSKKKKKSKNHSRDSHSPSYSHSFKKHHSGHKKSSNAARVSQTSSSDRNHLHHKALPVDNEKGPLPTNRSSHRDSLNMDRESLNQPHSSTSVSHPVAPGFQPSYLPLPDTVQHIPVNLWVSTWPALPVSHTYHAPRPPPPSSNLPGSSHTVPLNASPSFPPVAPAHNAPGPSTNALDSHTISSDSSSEYDSDDAHDRQIPSLKNVDSRTMHWLETHCPDLGKLQSSSSSATEVITTCVSSTTSTMSSSSSSSSSDTAVSNVIQHPLPSEKVGQTTEIGTADNNVDVEVVSVGSEEEDVVICSSSGDSDSDDVHCLEEQPPTKTSQDASSSRELDSVIPSSSKVLDSTEKTMSTLPFLSDFNDSTISTSTASNIILPPTNKTFQPFKLSRKSALTHQGKDPFFPSMSHSSDEDEDHFGKSDSPKLPNSQVLATSSRVQKNLTTLPASTLFNSLDHVHDIVKTSVAGSNEEGTNKHALENNRNSEGNEQWKSNTSEHLPNSQTSGDTQGAYSTSSYSNAGTVMFNTLTSMQQSMPSASTVLPSKLNYLPYSSLPPPPPAPPPTSLPSILPQPLPFGIPPSTAQPPSLALHFPFTPLTPMLTQTQTPTLLPQVYQAANQGISSPAFDPTSSKLDIFKDKVEASSFSKTVDSDGKVCLPLSSADSNSTTDNAVATENSVYQCHSEILPKDILENSFVNASVSGTSYCSENNDGIVSSINNENSELIRTFVTLPESDNSAVEKNNDFAKGEDIVNGNYNQLLNFEECPSRLNVFGTQDFLEPDEAGIIPEENSGSALESERASDQVLHPEVPSVLHSSASLLDSVILSGSMVYQTAELRDTGAVNASSSNSSENKKAEGAQDLHVNNETNPHFPVQSGEKASVTSYPHDDGGHEMPNVQEIHSGETIVPFKSSHSEGDAEKI